MRTIAIALLLFVVTASPALAASLNDLATGQGNVEVPEKMDDKTIEQWQEKERAYAEALNSVNSVRNTMKSYRNWAKDGPRADTKNVRGISDMSSSLKRIQKAAEKNAKVPAKILPMDVTFENLSDAAGALMAVNSEANKYYSRKDYLEDGMAKGMELHPQLLEKYDAFIVVAERLDAMKEQLTEGLAPQKLNLIEKKYGQEYYWHHVRLMGKARAVVSFLPDNANDAVNSDGYDAAIADFSSALKEFEEYYTKTGEEAVRKQSRMGLNPNSFNSFLAAAREVGQDMKAGKKNNAYVNHINAMVRDYNRLIDNSNRTTFLLKK